MKKLLLSTACAALTCSAFGSVPSPRVMTPAGNNFSTDYKEAKKPVMKHAKKITPTPETQWGEWEED